MEINYLPNILLSQECEDQNNIFRKILIFFSCIPSSVLFLCHLLMTFFFYLFFFISLFERVTERLLVRSPEGSNSHGWACLKVGARSSSEVFQVDDRPPDTGAIIYHLFRAFSRELDQKQNSGPHIVAHVGSLPFRWSQARMKSVV